MGRTTSDNSIGSSSSKSFSSASKDESVLSWSCRRSIILWGGRTGGTGGNETSHHFFVLLLGDDIGPPVPVADDNDEEFLKSFFFVFVVLVVMRQSSGGSKNDIGRFMRFFPLLAPSVLFLLFSILSNISKPLRLRLLFWVDMRSRLMTTFIAWSSFSTSSGSSETKQLLAVRRISTGGADRGAAGFE